MSITNIKVKLSGEDGNAFLILGRVKREMERNKVPQDVIDKYEEEATSGDYSHLLSVTEEYVDVY